MKITREDLYRCFSGKQKKFLLEKGNDYILRAKDYRSDNTFWLFIRDDKLNSDLKEWKETNPRFNKIED